MIHGLGGDCVQYLDELTHGSFEDRQIADLVQLTQRIRKEKTSSRDSMAAYPINMAVRLKQMKRVLKPIGTIYLQCDPEASHYLKLVLDIVFGKSNFHKLIWQYFMGGKSEKDFARKHDVILRYSKTSECQFNTQIVNRHLDYKPSLGDDSKITKQWKDELGYWSKVKCPDVWPIKSVFNWSREYLGYPTQKPLELLRRIIKASSNLGDFVLDPFCGCGTIRSRCRRTR